MDVTPFCRSEEVSEDTCWSRNNYLFYLVEGCRTSLGFIVSIGCAPSYSLALAFHHVSTESESSSLTRSKSHLLAITNLIPTALGIVAEGCCYGDSLLKVTTIRTQSNLGYSIDRSVNLLIGLTVAVINCTVDESKSFCLVDTITIIVEDNISRSTCQITIKLPHPDIQTILLHVSLGTAYTWPGTTGKVVCIIPSPYVDVTPFCRSEEVSEDTCWSRNNYLFYLVEGCRTSLGFIVSIGCAPSYSLALAFHHVSTESESSSLTRSKSHLLAITNLIPTALGIVAEGCCYGDSLLKVTTIRTQSNLGYSIDRSVNLLGTCTTIILQVDIACDTSDFTRLCTISIIQDDIEILYAIERVSPVFSTINLHRTGHYLTRPCACQVFAVCTCCPSMDVRSISSLYIYHDRSIRIYLGEGQATALHFTVLALCAPINSLGVAKVHTFADGKVLTHTRSQVHLILALYLIPTRLSVFRESNCHVNSLSAE